MSTSVSKKKKKGMSTSGLINLFYINNFIRVGYLDIEFQL